MSGKFKTFTRMMAGAIALSCALLAFSASGAGEVSAQGTGANDAHIRVIHASPDAPAVDVYINGNKVISDLAFGKVSPWATLPAGTYSIRVTAAGQTDAVIQADLSLQAGTYYSVAAVGKLTNIKPAVFVDDLSPLNGKARLRVIHASPDTPAVDVAVKGGPVLVSNLTFPNASDYLTVDPMTVDVEVRPAGTTTVALAIPGFSLEAARVYSVYAVGLSGGTPALSVLPVVDSATGSAPTGTASPGMPTTGAGGAFGPMLALLALMAMSALVLGRALCREAEHSR
jgi:hypothetical protein